MTKLADHFCHLHAHSCYSIKDGSIPIKTLVDKQVEFGAPGVAVTDHGMMTGGWFLYDYITSQGISAKPIIGIEAYVSLTRNELFEWLPRAAEEEPDKEKRAAKRRKLAKKYHQILLAQNETGYYNLVKIHNDAWLNGYYYSPATTKEVIFENSEGVIATTTCLASIWNQYIINGNIEAAEREIWEWKGVFGDRFFIELQTTDLREQIAINKILIELARKTNTPLIVTNDVHYVDPGDDKFHYLLLNMSDLKEGKEGSWEFGVTDLYIKNVDQMKDTWRKLHKDKVFTESVFDESVETIGMIVESVEVYNLYDKPQLPKYDPQRDSFDILKQRAVLGFKQKIDEGLIPKSKIEQYKERLVLELRTMKALKAVDYMLIYADIADYCHRNNIAMGPGRGSAPGSLLLWLLGVTEIDPVRWNLLLERFINKNRRPRLKL